MGAAWEGQEGFNGGRREAYEGICMSPPPAAACKSLTLGLDAIGLGAILSS
jgi:hypothetical protein